MDWMHSLPEEKRELVFEKRHKAYYEDEEVRDAYHIERLDGPPQLSLRGDSAEPVNMPSFLGWKRLADAFGVKDIEFVKLLVKQMAQFVMGDGGANNDELNAMVAFVIGLKPRDEAEAAMITRMAMTHALNVAVARHVRGRYTLEAMNSFAKLERVYQGQMAVLKNYRKGSDQNITVHHVSVRDGGQAIVGNVMQGARNTSAAAPWNGAEAAGVSQVPGISQAPLTHSGEAPMPSLEGTAQPVPSLSEAAPALIPAEQNKCKARKSKGK